jgi:hypothetical protein
LLLPVIILFKERKKERKKVAWWKRVCVEDGTSKIITASPGVSKNYFLTKKVNLTQIRNKTTIV